jgi:hypothetical protein
MMSFSLIIFIIPYAKVSKELIPIQGISKQSLNAFAVATPILIPVNEPWTYIANDHINIIYI